MSNTKMYETDLKLDVKVIKRNYFNSKYICAWPREEITLIPEIRPVLSIIRPDGSELISIEMIPANN